MNPSLALPATAREAWLIAGRCLRHIPRHPEKLLDVTVQPVMFTIIFLYIFGSAVHLPNGVNYHEFLIAGLLGQSMTATLMGLSVGVAEDMQTGMIDRLRALPISRFSVLAGRSIAQVVENSLGILTTVVLGLIVGWRPHGSVPDILIALLLLQMWGLALSWIGIFIGLIVRDAETAQQLTFTAVLPLMFLSGTFVPVGGLGTPFRQIAEWSPLSCIVASVRGWLHNASPPLPDVWPLEHSTLATVLWAVLLTAVFAPLAVRRYRRMDSQ